ncbi:MAG: DUF86 domain-containing protein [Elusimicrobia bacterium]|nr:DUF86 domain-containing protein [Elusimicrobiota bacterium]
MVAHASLDARLRKLREYCALLSTYRKASLENLKRDATLRGAVERYLQLAIECCLDIGEIVISEKGLRQPADYRDVLLVLGENGVLPQRFARRFSDAAALRNILVHEYLEVDLRIVVDVLRRNLKDFDAFARHIAGFLLRG